MSIHQSVSSKLKKILIICNATPLRCVLACIYACAVTVAVSRLRKIKAVHYIALSGSLAIGDALYGHSDIDLFIVLDCPEGQRHYIMQWVRQKLKSMSAFFPLFGTLDERMAGVYWQTDIDHAVFSEPITLKAKSIMCKTLYCHPDLRMPKRGDSYTPQEVLIEIKTIMKLLFHGALQREGKLSFFRNKIRALIVIYQNSFDMEAIKHVFESRCDVYDYACVLMRSGPVGLYFSLLSCEHDRMLMDMCRMLIKAIIAKYGLSDLETIDVPLDTTYVISDTCDNGIVVPNHISFNQHEGAITDTNCVITRVGDNETIGFNEIANYAHDIMRSDRNVFMRIDTIIVHCEKGDCVNVFSVFDAPNLFPQEWPDRQTIRFKKIFYEMMRARQEHTLAVICEKYAPLISPEDTAFGTLTTFIDLEKIFFSYSVIHAAKNFLTNHIVAYKTMRDVFTDLAQQYPAYDRLFVLLEHYYDMFRKNTVGKNAHMLPPNLIPTANDFFAHYLFDKEWRGMQQLDKKLSLSLCVCTKNRAAYLSALLASVASQTRQPDELVVVDNNSSDNTREIVAQYERAFPIIYVNDNADTIAALRNRAIQESQGEIVSFTDDDCVLDANWLYFVEESFLRDPCIGAVGGRVYHYDEGTRSGINLFHQEYLGVWH